MSTKLVVIDVGDVCFSSLSPSAETRQQRLRIHRRVFRWKSTSPDGAPEKQLVSCTAGQFVWGIIFAFFRDEQALFTAKNIFK